jgi:hypothetical protein
MGYTHYWKHGEISPADWAWLVWDTKQIIEAADVPLANGVGIAGTKPELSKDRIWLNGVEENGAETFVLVPEETDFNFTKTDLEPYDLIVSTVLLRATLTVPRFRVKSDGTWYEWGNAISLYVRVFGVVPPSETPLVQSL